MLVLFASACSSPAPVAEGGSSSTGQDSTSSSSAAQTGAVETTDETLGDSSSGGGATTGEQLCAGAWDGAFSIPMPTLPPGDPQAGYEALLTEDYVSCGIPWNMFGLASGALGESEPLPGREGKNAEVGHEWNVIELEDGSEVVVSNCLQCHAGNFNGELIVGLGKTELDMTRSFNETLDLIPPLLPTSMANRSFNKFKERVSAIGPYGTMATVGANPAVMYAVVLLAHRDPLSLAWSDEPKYELLPDNNIPADVPPWWRASKKATHFANGMSRGDHRGTLILASSLCTDSVDEAGEMLDYFTDIQAFITSLEAPLYPFPVDEALAAEGEEIFDCECAGCHGTYDEDPSLETYPNLLVPLATIGTDPGFASYAGPGGVYHHLEDRFNASYYGTISQVVTADPVPGYTAPPLDGIWATAPFFHNGSVPNLELVLDSTARPTYWRRVDFDSTHFDQVAVGWPWVETPVGHADADGPDRKFIYDTTLFGYGNGGHTFGDHLTGDQRTAVIEYLKTL